MTHRLGVLVALLIASPMAVGWTQAQATQSPPLDCTWLLVDTISRTATFQLMGGMTDLNGGMNFNGFKDGALTVTVPLNWNVVVRFTNRDANTPHSAQIADSVTPLPAGPVKSAFPRAETTRPMQGHPAGREEEVKFVANRAGRYLIWCAVPGHGIAGMWIRFTVSRTDTRPTLRAPSAS